MGNRRQIGCVTVNFLPQEGSSPNEVIARLVETFGARITCHDWYANRRLCTLRTIESHKNAGTSVPNPQLLLDDIDRAASEGGLRVGIAVPMEGGGYMIGDITSERLVLTACCLLEESESVKAVVAFLHSLNIVAKVDVT
jgi:hypothetical protein